ncbi:hypothetical protein HPB47_024129, partial [Ixodes persulcatus]
RYRFDNELQKCAGQSPTLRPVRKLGRLPAGTMEATSPQGDRYSSMEAGRNDDVFDRSHLPEQAPSLSLAQRCAAFLVPRRLRSYMRFEDREGPDAPGCGGGGGGGGGGSGTWCPEQRDLLRRDVETLDLLVLKLEDLAGTLRDAMHLSSSQSSPQSPGSPGCRRVETAPYFIRFQLPIVAFCPGEARFRT